MDSVVIVDYDNGCLWHDEKLTKDFDWYLFSVENNAKLKISNSKFENWQFRQRSVINIYRGEVHLENVDFEYTEA